MEPKKNILQIDVEDWFCDLDPNEWKNYEPRVVENTEEVLRILKKTRNKATFFMLGHVAEKFPNLVKQIVKEGHELATHGYAHQRIDQQTPQEFKKDLDKSLKILKKITGKKAKGYRAPQFTITKATLWALDIIKELGLIYDSSIFPVKTPIYGMDNAPICPYRIKCSYGKFLFEVAPSVHIFPIVKKRFPFSGGFYLRFLPYFFIKHAIKKINKNNEPAVLYIHPWDLDPNKPKIKPKSLFKYYSFDSSDKSLKWFHYYGLKSAKNKFKKLLNDFKFTSTMEWLKDGTR